MTPSRRERQVIRRVFLKMDRAAEYHLSGVARLLSISVRELRQRVSSGELEAQERDGVPIVRWGEIAFLGVERWGLVTIAWALGNLCTTRCGASRSS